MIGTFLRKLTTEEIARLKSRGVSVVGRITVVAYNESLGVERRARYEVLAEVDSKTSAAEAVVLSPCNGQGDMCSSRVSRDDYRVTHAGLVAREASSVARHLASALGIVVAACVPSHLDVI